MDLTKRCVFICVLCVKAHVMALEWGSPDLDDTQWCYVAYETLLLIYAYLVDEVVL